MMGQITVSFLLYLEPKQGPIPNDKKSLFFPIADKTSQFENF